MRKVYPFLIVSLVLAYSVRISAQCPITVNAGEDVWLCSPPASTQLNATIDGDYVDFTWSPLAGMSGFTTLSPTVTVSQTTTYALTAQAVDLGSNLIVNGDFEGGNFGFSSDYNYNPGFTGPPWGSYEVTTTPSIFPNCGDHTSGSGNYMVIDGADNPDLLVWCQTVTVTPNTDYALTAWAVSFTNASPFALLEFTINGTPVGTLSVPGPSCTWHQFSTVWNSGANSSATICIEDLVVTGANNDFALDDISLSPVCQVTDSVTVHTVSIAAVATPAISVIPCEGANLTLNGVGSSTGDDISYTWEGPGLVSGENTLNPVVNAPGTYTLTVTFDNGMTVCSKTASVSVVESPNPLIAWIDPPAPLGCGASTSTLLGHSSQPGFSQYQWTAGPGGNFISGQNGLNAIVDQPGDYTLLVTNTSTGCTAEATVTVTANTNPPTAVATASGVITCDQNQINLFSTGSSTGSTINYAWSTLSGGDLIAGQMDTTALVNGPGTYVLTVTNTANACTATDTVQVNSTSLPPQITFDTAGVFTCAVDTLGLSATITPALSVPAWTAQGGGTIVSGASTLNPQVTGAGTYVLMATDTLTGCTTSDTLIVGADLMPPTAVIQPAGTLTCLQTSLMLSGDSSSVGANFSYSWMASPGGNIVSGAGGLNPVVDAPGTYTLLVTDNVNGCTADTTVDVGQDITLPPAEAGADGLLTCNLPVFSLTANNGLADTTLAFTWQTPDGHFTSNPDSISVECDQPGTYLLTVTNLQNGCTTTDTAFVAADQLPPTIQIDPPAALTCVQTTTTINAAGGNADIIYQWQTTAGQFVSGQQTSMPVVDLPGLYTLLVTDTANGCSATFSTTVDQDIAVPTAGIAQAAVLTCASPQASLQGSAGPGTGLDVFWTAGNGGNILSGANTLTPVINQPGIYQLTVTDTINGCTNTASITVSENTTEPTADAGTDTNLSCSVSTLSLQGAGSTSGAPVFSWTAGNSGNILSGSDTPTPLINAPGTYTLVVTDQENGCTASDTVVIQQDADAPTATIDPPGLLTCAVTQLILQANGSTGGSFTLQWTAANGGNIVTGANTLTPTVDQAGTYLLTIVNTDNGCSATAQGTVQQDITPPTIAIDPPETLTCAVTSVNLSASSATNLSFLWQTQNGNIVAGNTTATPTVETAGVYTVTATSTNNGCTAIASTTVVIDTLPPAITLAQPQTLTCMLQEITLSGNVTQPAANFTTNWTTPDGQIVSGQNTLMPVINAPGTYLLTVQNQQNGCAASASTVVLENTAPPMAAIGPAPVISCQQPQVSLDASASSGTGMLSFSWSGGQIVSGQNTAYPVISEPTTYTLIITDAANGCTATGSVIVAQDTNLPQALIAPPAVLTCVQASIMLDATASSSGPSLVISWTTLNGHFTGGQNTLSPTVDAAGQYTLTLVNQQNGCSASASINVQENLTPPNAEAGPGDELHCMHPQVTLQGTSSTPGPLTYLWTTTNGHFTTPADLAMPQVDAAGTYILTVTNPANGCTATDQVVITEIPLPVFTATVLQPDCHTPNGSVTFSGLTGGTLPYGFSVNGGQQFQAAPVFNTLVPGNYELVLEDANGCTASENVSISPPVLPSVSLQGPELIALGDSVQLQPVTTPPTTSIVSWAWTPATGLSCTSCPGPWASPMMATQYTLSITDQNGCTATGTIAVHVNRQRQIYAPNIFSPNGDGENDIFLLFGRGVVELRTMRIFNRWGELIFERQHIPVNTADEGWDGTFRGEQVQPGVYVWQAEIEFVDGEVEVFTGDVTVFR